MSIFGQRIAIANQIVDDEMADDFIYEPMVEVINGEPEPDIIRVGGPCRAVLLAPGSKLGSGWSLQSMHERVSASITLHFMARGVLADVQHFDRFTLAGPYSNPDQPKRYEVAADPMPTGFGRYRVPLLELALTEGTPLKLPSIEKKINPMQKGVVEQDEEPF